jgi:hypothetical protein
MQKPRAGLRIQGTSRHATAFCSAVLVLYLISAPSYRSGAQGCERCTCGGSPRAHLRKSYGGGCDHRTIRPRTSSHTLGSATTSLSGVPMPPLEGLLPKRSRRSRGKAAREAVRKEGAVEAASERAAAAAAAEGTAPAKEGAAVGAPKKAPATSDELFSRLGPARSAAYGAQEGDLPGPLRRGLLQSAQGAGPQPPQQRPGQAQG